jgi:hypothetical protein
MLTQDIPRPTPNHPASFSVGRWRGENLKSWKSEILAAHFAGLDVSFSDFQDFSFPARSDAM